jgi:hypothetical protein
MLDIDTFLTTLYVLVDDFCKDHPLSPDERTVWTCGRPIALCRSEVLTLSIFGQWSRFQSERGFYRFAQQRLRPLFPRLPDRSQFLRAQARYETSLHTFVRHLPHWLGAELAPYEALDRVGIATRNCSRRGSEWLAGLADKGFCSRLGYFWGFHLLDACTPEGVITGFGFCPASRKDQPQAEQFFHLRCAPDPALPWIGEHGESRTYVVDKGFSGPHLHRGWERTYGISIVGAPQAGHGPEWPKAWLQWLASIRQIIETVHEKLLCTFRLATERPHCLRGLRIRLSSKVALHNVCIWMNRQLGRPSLEFATLLAW